MNHDGKRILIVEDEAALLFGLTRLLKDSETQIDTSTTLSEAAKLLKQNSYQFIITDLRLSGSNSIEGFDIVKLAKKYQPYGKVAIMTAYAESAILEKAKELGVDYFLEKPIPLSKIKELLSSC